MQVRLVSHINGDDDLLDAWFEYYRRLSIVAFHLIVHGPVEENRRLYALKDTYPVIFEDCYQGPFDSEEKKRRLNLLLARLRGEWILLVDSDEFVELPYSTLDTTIRLLTLTRKTALYAPMVQHLTPDGSLCSPPIIKDPFRFFPLCSIDLYTRIGAEASIDKYPLFLCGERTMLLEGGNHNCPSGNTASSLQGVTHHFKFRSTVFERLEKRIQSSHPWRHKSLQQQAYLKHHGNSLPLEGTFAYSRSELFRRGLLRKLTLGNGLRYLSRTAKGMLLKLSSG